MFIIGPNFRRDGGQAGKRDCHRAGAWLNYDDDFHCLLDGELFLPESWAREAGHVAVRRKLPPTMSYQSQDGRCRVGTLRNRARANGIQVLGERFDEWYGGKPAFLRAVGPTSPPFVAEPAKSCRGRYAADAVFQRLSEKSPRSAPHSDKEKTLCSSLQSEPQVCRNGR